MSTVIALQNLLESARPDALILISDDQPLIRAASAATTWHATGDSAWEQLSTAPQAPLAVIDGEANFPPKEAPLVAGRLRDLHSRRVVVIGPNNPNQPLNRQVLIALGFHHIGQSSDETGNRDWFEFDIATYKVTPDWLNPRHWANPELWDKYRW